jgi:hypothetical protein
MSELIRPEIQHARLPDGQVRRCQRSEAFPQVKAGCESFLGVVVVDCCGVCRSRETDLGRSLHIPSFSALHTADTGSPSSPWPQLEYDPDYVPEDTPPETPRRQYSVEICVMSSDQGGGDGGTGSEESAQQTLCNVRMAQVFKEKPHLREQLVDILRTCPEDSALKMQASRRLEASSRHHNLEDFLPLLDTRNVIIQRTQSLRLVSRYLKRFAFPCTH